MQIMIGAILECPYCKNKIRPAHYIDYNEQWVFESALLKKIHTCTKCSNDFACYVSCKMDVSVDCKKIGDNPVVPTEKAKNEIIKKMSSDVELPPLEEGGGVRYGPKIKRQIKILDKQCQG